MFTEHIDSSICRVPRVSHCVRFAAPADVVIYKQEKRRASRARKRLAKQQIASGKRSVGGNTVKSKSRERWTVSLR